MKFPRPYLVSAVCLATTLAGAVDAKPVRSRKPAVVSTPARTVLAANADALQGPQAGQFLNAVQVYAWTEGALYRLFTAPDKVSDIVLQAGEELIAVSAGDTARWVIGDTVSGAGEARQVHIMVKPFAAGLKTNLIITTNRRTYHLQLESTTATAMAAVLWRYPSDPIVAKKIDTPVGPPPTPVVTGLDVEHLRFAYTVTGDRPAWRPIRVFDDGRKVYIEFPESLAQTDAPPLFLVGADGRAELINYRQSGRFYVVDSLFAAAELRIGAKRQTVVRITRTDAAVKVSGRSTENGHD